MSLQFILACCQLRRHFQAHLVNHNCWIRGDRRSVYHSTAQPNNKESKVTQICDTIILDNFTQVAGLLMNSNDDISLDEAFIATGIEAVSISARCDFPKEGFWRVYTMVTQFSPSKVTADIFAVNKDGSLLVIIIGVNFSKLSLRQIGISLEHCKPDFTSRTP